MIYVSAALLILVLLCFGLIGCCQRWVIYPGSWNIPTSRQEKPLPAVQVMRLHTDAGPVEAWLLKGQGVSAAHPGPAVIYAHGNDELMDFHQHEMAGYTSVGVSVLLVEYRGYGRSAGSPTQTHITHDMVAFYDRLAARPDVDADRIVYHGRSLGGGVIGALARHRRPAAMILQSTFTSVPAIAANYFIPAFLIRDQYHTLAFLRRYHRPVLIMQGTRDETIPPNQARILHKAASRSTLIFFKTDHDTPPPRRKYWADIHAFLRRADIVR